MGKLLNTIVRNGVYYVHVRIPHDLVASYEGSGSSPSLSGPRTASKRVGAARDAMVDINNEFDEKRARLRRGASKGREERSPAPALSFAEIARQHAREVADKEFAERAELFEGAYADSSQLWKGELVALPESRYFDHLVEDGDLDKIVGYIARTRLKDRVAQLRRMLEGCRDCKARY